MLYPKIGKIDFDDSLDCEMEEVYMTKSDYLEVLTSLVDLGKLVDKHMYYLDEYSTEYAEMESLKDNIDNSLRTLGNRISTAND